MKDSTQLKLWILAFVLTCLVAWAGHGAISRLSPPALPKVKKPHKSAAVHQGAGSARLIAKVVVPQPHTNTIAWQYPPGMNPNNYFWNVEASVDLTNWSVVISNASGVSEVMVAKNEPLRAWRLSGRSSP